MRERSTRSTPTLIVARFVIPPMRSAGCSRSSPSERERCSRLFLPSLRSGHFYFGHRTLGAAAIATASLSLTLSLHEWRRRRACKESTRSDIERAAGDDPDRIHLIAHSFGAVIAGHTLIASHGLLFEQLILIGAALPEDFDWE
jgi:hypothetical protein